MEESWRKFWGKRSKPLNISQLKTFENNFFAMYAIIQNHFWRNGFKSQPSSLEIGCGRATISDFMLRMGFDTYTMDKIYVQGNKHVFFEHDVLNEEWSSFGTYDIILSYGLLEHFKWRDQIRILINCDKYLSHKGLQIHYVVPRKLTNVMEDRSVYRDKCKELINWFDGTWVYPIWGDRWITNEFWGKAFIISGEKRNENTCISNCQVTIN